jgi:hypothetical protein
MSDTFNGFPRDAFTFFAGVARNNNRDWFQATLVHTGVKYERPTLRRRLSDMPSKISLSAVIAAIFIVAAAMAPLANAGPPDDACSLLTQAQVTSALNVSVGAGSYATPTFKKTCTWNASSDVTTGVKYVTLMLQGLDAYQAGKLAQVKTIVVTSISGIGDDAYYLAVGSNVGLIVKKGNVAFKVAVYGNVPIEKKQAMEKLLAQQVVSKL